MLCISAYSRLLKSIAATVLVAGLTAAQAQTPAGQKRPATIPKNYIITPFGYFHPRGVAHLGKRDVGRQDETAIRHANRTPDNIHICANAHDKADGEEVTEDKRAVKQPTINGWVESASTPTVSSYAYLYASWTASSAPSTDDGQVVFLFSGMEDINGRVTIIQPVRGWTSDDASGWGIASWNWFASDPVLLSARAQTSQKGFFPACVTAVDPPANCSLCSRILREI